VQTLHEKYGKVVILAPKEISIIAADDLREVYVSHKLDKPPEATTILLQFNERNLVTTEDASLHARRRRIVAPAYGAPTIISERSQAVYRKLTGLLCEEIDKEISASPDCSCNIWYLLRFLATDIMTHVVFGSEDALNSLEDPAHRHVVRMVLIPIQERRVDSAVLMMQWYPRKLGDSSTPVPWIPG
jgi:hypothetical protein